MKKKTETLFDAVNSGDSLRVKEVLSKVDEYDEKRSLSVILAASRDRSDLLDLMNEAGVSLRARDQWGNTALMEAAHNGCQNSALFLLENTKDLDLKEIKTAFEIACGHGRFECAKKMFEWAQNGNVDLDLSEAFQAACANGFSKVALWLYEEGAYWNKEDSQGRNAVDWLHLGDADAGGELLEALVDAVVEKGEVEFIREAMSKEELARYAPKCTALLERLELSANAAQGKPKIRGKI